jgi:hypothetical protein
MVTSETPPGGGGPITGPDRHDGAPPSDLPLTRLRGAGVDVDPRRAGKVIIGVCLVALAVTAVVLIVAGVQKNNQDNSLHTEGVPVAVTVQGCLGLLGGSGSNPAGYACRGTYTFHGHRYDQNIPGNRDLVAGTTIRGVIVPGDPYLLSTPGLVAVEHASWHVFIAPVILLGVLVLAVVVLPLVRKRRHADPMQG